MNYQLHNNKRNRSLIPSMGKRLTVLLCFLVSVVAMRGQVTGTITVPTNTVINNACDLQLLCAINGPGIDINTTYLIFVDDMNSNNILGFGYNNGISPFSLARDKSVSSGLHKFLLSHSGQALDSIELFIQSFIPQRHLLFFLVLII